VRTVPAGMGPKVIVAEVHVPVADRVGPEKNVMSFPDESLQKICGIA
jgi:hypothetical protein